MPIKPERKKLYPENWEKISDIIIEKAGYKCELCGIPNHDVRNGAEVVLTVHHINHDPTDNRRVNLIALCQRCHLRLDAPWRRKSNIGNLFKSRGNDEKNQWKRPCKHE